MEAEASSRRPLLFWRGVHDGPKPEKDPSPVPSKAGSQTGPPPFPAVIWSRIARP